MSNLSVKHLQYVKMKCDPDNFKKSTKEFADTLKVTVKSVYRWNEMPKVQKAIEDEIRKQSFSKLPYAWKCLEERMPKDTNAIKLFFALTGDYKDQMEISGPNGGPVRLSWLAKQSEEDLEKMIEELR